MSNRCVYCKIFEAFPKKLPLPAATGLFFRIANAVVCISIPPHHYVEYLDPRTRLCTNDDHVGDVYAMYNVRTHNVLYSYTGRNSRRR